MVVSRLIAALRDPRRLPLVRGGSLVVAALLIVVRPIAAFDERGTGTGPADTTKAAGGTAGARSSPDQQPVLALIRLLGDRRFEVREEASKVLEQAGIAAVAPLREAAAGENLEITCRAIKALSSIVATSDDATFDAVEGALEQLELSSNWSAARRATSALASQALRRWKRALVRLNAHGGGVKWKTRNESEVPEPNLEFAGSAYPASVMVGENWSGGNAGLVNIKRIMFSLQALVNASRIPPIPLPLPVYLIDGANIAPEALEELQQSLPGLEIVPRGRAKLGVLSESRAPPCIISDVEPNRAAHKAGLRRGDVVVKYDSETVADFDHLTRITRRHKAGDRVKLEVDREGTIVELEVELSGWDELAPMPKAK